MAYCRTDAYVGQKWTNFGSGNVDRRVALFANSMTYESSRDSLIGYDGNVVS